MEMLAEQALERTIESIRKFDAIHFSLGFATFTLLVYRLLA